MKNTSTKLRISATAFALLVNLPLLCAADPTVSNVRASQRAQSQLVDVFYDLSAADNGPFWLTVAVSTNNGTAYDLPASSFAGNGIGDAVTPGIRRQVVWDAGKDWPGQYSGAVRFKVTASTDTPPAGMVLIPQGVNNGINRLGKGESNNLAFYPSVYSITVNAFYMDRTEVTKAHWDEVRSWGISHGYTDMPEGAGKGMNHPVQMVNWFDVVKWCNARSEMEGRIPAYYTTSTKTSVYTTGQINLDDNCVDFGNGYRLPTEIQWEYAARGGVSSTLFPWGSNRIAHGNSNYYSATNSVSYDKSQTQGYHPAYNDTIMPYTSPVGSFSTNGYGLYDMGGNAWEWCWNWYPGYEGTGRVIRGGAFSSLANDCRVGLRSMGLPIDSRTNFTLGFRTILPTARQEQLFYASIGPTGGTFNINSYYTWYAAVSGGTPPYTYLWSGSDQNGAFSSTNTNFGTYFATIVSKQFKVIVTDTRGAVAVSKTNAIRMTFGGGGIGEL